jgi:hypothetical protein
MRVLFSNHFVLPEINFRVANINTYICLIYVHVVRTNHYQFSFHERQEALT